MRSFNQISADMSSLHFAIDRAFIALCNKQISSAEYVTIAEPYWAVCAEFRACIAANGSRFDY